MLVVSLAVEREQSGKGVRNLFKSQPIGKSFQTSFPDLFGFSVRFVPLNLMIFWEGLPGTSPEPSSAGSDRSRVA
jgi:hypothetical protein